MKENNKRRTSGIDVIVGKNLRKHRHISKMSQQQVADELGISYQQIQKYEAGTNRISASRLHNFANLFDADINDFFLGLDAKTARSPLASIDKETAELLRLFQEIGDPEMKKSLIRILKSYVSK
ncbi:helix-turn-helix transcriptional regulator [Nitratireductor sp.]|uniref:helix-turn-helix domain-containing protein n=1 Tax=Nitratireductor sp. TaxID=1872084 RepID=UPI002639393E|nr:helix-turn-helix transcriptional regulator [Nitratireductor sp.]MCV0381714.1 helix-turn-helix domain-containing protein [Nitratireductor sp.]